LTFSVSSVYRRDRKPLHSIGRQELIVRMLKIQIPMEVIIKDIAVLGTTIEFLLRSLKPAVSAGFMPGI
jgi:hypothetical protein